MRLPTSSRSGALVNRCSRSARFARSTSSDRSLGLRREDDMGDSLPASLSTAKPTLSFHGVGTTSTVPPLGDFARCFKGRIQVCQFVCDIRIDQVRAQEGFIIHTFGYVAG
jgi:hypothetical protein